MQRGDLASSPLPQLLAELAGDAATGCLYVTEPTGGEAHLYLDAGRLDAARRAPAADPLGARLHRTAAVSAEELATAIGEASAGTNLGLADVLIRTGTLEATRFANLSLELAIDAVETICGWSTGAWRFRRRQRASIRLPEPLSLEDLLARLDVRDAERRELTSRLGTGDDGVLGAQIPQPEEFGEADDRAGLPVEDHAVLDLVDGNRTIAAIAERCGRSDLSVAQVLAEHRERLAAAPEPPSSGWNKVHDEAELSLSLARASEALNAAMGEGEVEEEPETVLRMIRTAPATSTPAAPVDPELAARRERLRAAAAAELAAAHAEAEEARRAGPAEVATPEMVNPEMVNPEVANPEVATAEVVDLAARREAARQAREAAAAPAQEPEQVDPELPGPSAAPVEAEPVSAEVPATEAPPAEEPASEKPPAEQPVAEALVAAAEPPESPVVPDARAAQLALSMLSQELAVDEATAAEPETPAADEASVLDEPVAAPARPVLATEDHHIATALLREMAGELPAPPAPEPAPVAPAEPQPDATHGTTSGLHRPAPASGAADTAALLRELSSLGGEEAGGRPTPSGGRPTGTRPAPSPAAGRRRKGLWGRG